MHARSLSGIKCLHNTHPKIRRSGSDLAPAISQAFHLLKFTKKYRLAVSDKADAQDRYILVQGWKHGQSTHQIQPDLAGCLCWLTLSLLNGAYPSHNAGPAGPAPSSCRQFLGESLAHFPTPMSNHARHPDRVDILTVGSKSNRIRDLQLLKILERRISLQRVSSWPQRCGIIIPRVTMNRKYFRSGDPQQIISQKW